MSFKQGFLFGSVAIPQGGRHAYVIRESAKLGRAFPLEMQRCQSFMCLGELDIRWQKPLTWHAYHQHVTNAIAPIVQTTTLPIRSSSPVS